MSITTILIVIAVIVFLIVPSFKDRIIPVKKLIAMPAVFVYLLFQSIMQHFATGLASKAIIVVGLVMGSAIGAFIRSNVTVKVDQTNKLIWIPGSYISLIVFVVIFAAHFLAGYVESVAPTYLAQEGVTEFVLLLLTMATGLTVGTNLCLFAKYHFAKSEPLT